MVACLQVLKRRMSERKDDTEHCVLLLRKLGEPDRTLQDRCARLLCWNDTYKIWGEGKLKVYKTP